MKVNAAFKKASTVVGSRTITHDC